MGADVVDAVGAVNSTDCCFSEMDSIAADCPAVITLCVEEVEGGLDLTIEAQDLIVE